MDTETELLSYSRPTSTITSSSCLCSYYFNWNDLQTTKYKQKPKL